MFITKAIVYLNLLTIAWGCFPTDTVTTSDETTTSSPTTTTDEATTTTAEPTTTEPKTWKLCYDFATDGSIHLGNCTTEECPDEFVEIATDLDENCTYTPTGYVRCFSDLDRTAICRPVEASCSVNEYQRPGPNMFRTSYTLQVVSETLQECEGMTPFVRCASPIRYNDPDPDCIPDTELCSDNNLVQVPSDQLFTDEDECDNYHPVAYLRCFNDATEKCIEYDAVTQTDCIEDGYYRQPSFNIFPDEPRCRGFGAKYSICFRDANEFVYCRSDGCDATGYEAVIIFNATYTECFEYVVKWQRFVDIGNDRRCRPVSDVTDFTPGENYVIVPYDKEYDSSDECLAAKYFIPCYNSDRNAYDCPQDISGCEDDEYPVSQNNSVLFDDWLSCSEYTTEAYIKCLDESNGDIVCRPSFVGCLEDEIYVEGSISPTESLCEVSNIAYFYCYDPSTPSERECVMDYVGCPDGAHPLNKDFEEEIYQFSSEQACNEASPLWVQCYPTASSPTAANTICRPLGGSALASHCETDESNVGAGPYSFYDECVADLPDSD